MSNIPKRRERTERLLKSFLQLSSRESTRLDRLESVWPVCPVTVQLVGIPGGRVPLKVTVPSEEVW